MTTLSTGFALTEPRQTPATALSAAFDVHAAALYRYFVVRTGDTHAADDLMQQLWMRVLAQQARLPVLRPEHWLRRCARRFFITHLRKNGRRPLAALPDAALAAQVAKRLRTEELPDSYLAQREVSDQLRLAITELPTREQEAIIAFYFHDESHETIARRGGVTPRAVEGLLYRARRSLRRALLHLDE